MGTSLHLFLTSEKKRFFGSLFSLKIFFVLLNNERRGTGSFFAQKLELRKVLENVFEKCVLSTLASPNKQIYPFVAQLLVEWSILIPEIHGSNPVIGIFYFLLPAV